jgi:hypothetical protein
MPLANRFGVVGTPKMMMMMMMMMAWVLDQCCAIFAERQLHALT